MIEYFKQIFLPYVNIKKIDMHDNYNNYFKKYASNNNV